MTGEIVMHEGQTGLAFRFPDVETVIREVRNAEDPYAHLMEAHITVALPFLHINDLTAEDVHFLEAVAAKEASFTMHFNSFGEFPGVLYLAPKETTEIMGFYSDLTTRWNHDAAAASHYTTFVPHLTVAQNNDKGVLNRIKNANTHFLLLSELVTHVDLVIVKNGVWVPHMKFKLS